MMLTLLDADFGTFRIEAEDGRDLLVQSDWDFPGLATTFGWFACPCGLTDGTVDCAHRTADEMIADAYAFLREHVGDTADDPGYF